MTKNVSQNRMWSFSDLNAYPGNAWLDRVVQLYWSPDPRRRVWLLIPETATPPELRIATHEFPPVAVSKKTPRWVDYGVIEMPGYHEEFPIWDGFVQIALRGLKISDCPGVWFVVTEKLDLSLEGVTMPEVQRALWGLAQEDVGSTTLTPAQMDAGASGTFRVRYTTGPQGLPAGAIIRFAVSKVLTPPQTDDPTLPGYTEILNPDADIEIVEIRDMLESHEKSSILCRVGSSLSPGQGFTLQYFTDQTFLYPKVFDEVEMRTWYSNLPPLTASTAVSEEAPFVNMKKQNGHSFTLVTGPIERLHLFLPGRRFASEKLSVKGTFTDYYRNVPPSGPIDTNITLWLDDGSERVSLASLERRFIAQHRFEVPLPDLSPGVYRVYAVQNDSGKEVARSNPLEIIPDNSGERLYWGEIHCHTELSDGSGDFAEVYRHAKYEGCLEFATVTDHAEYITDNQWGWMQDVINAWNDPGRFTTLVGYEWIGKQKDRIIYSARSHLELLRGTDRHTENLEDFWGRFAGDESIVGGPHASIVHKTLWEQHVPEVERFAEIYSMWGSCDFRDSPLLAPWVEPDRGVSVNEILMTGAKLGFTAGGDCHDGRVGFTSEDPERQGKVPHSNATIILYRCGMTASNMLNLDRADLVGALRNRRTYATTGARILLDFSISGHPMGAIGDAESAECKAVIHAVQSLKEVQIIKDGKVAWSQAIDGLDAELHWTDPAPSEGEHYYYLHIVQEDGQRAWSSPIWVK